jgi:hypothetical protein
LTPDVYVCRVDELMASASSSCARAINELKSCVSPAARRHPVASPRTPQTAIAQCALPPQRTATAVDLSFFISLVRDDTSPHTGDCVSHPPYAFASCLLFVTTAMSDIAVAHSLGAYAQASPENSTLAAKDAAGLKRRKC